MCEMDEIVERWCRDSSSNSPPPKAIYKTRGLFGLSLFRPQSVIEESWARAQGRSLEAGVAEEHCLLPGSLDHSQARVHLAFLSRPQRTGASYVNYHRQGNLI